jgi:hypothetical protein
MSLERLRELSEALGMALRRALADVDKDADIMGGGLRHGEVEWQVRYQWEGLERFLFFSLDEPSPHLVHLAVRAGATDARGRWAYVPVASTTLPKEIAQEQLSEVASSMLGHGRTIINSLGRDDLRPLVHNYFRGEEGQAASQ